MGSRSVFAGLATVLVAMALTTSCTRGSIDAPGQSTAASSPTPATPAPSPAPAPAPPSDEDQVRQTVMAFQEAYNTQKWDDYRALMCTAMRDGFTDPIMEQLKRTRTAQGLTHITVTDVDVEGDTATTTLDARNELLGRRTIQLTVTREDGWKVCQTTPVG